MTPLGISKCGRCTADQPGGNLLTNPGFESPYAKQCCYTEPGWEGLAINEVQVAHGWRGWWYPPGLDAAHPDYCNQDAPELCQAWRRPEWSPVAPVFQRIREGQNAQKYFTVFGVHEAGMYQPVAGITPGARLRFSIYMHAWSANGDDPVSSGQDYMGMKVGIDPTGGENPWSASIVWSPVSDAYDVYQLYTVEAVAQASAVTVFTHSQPMWGLNHNDVYLDDASLIVVGSAPFVPTSPPAAGNDGGATSPPVGGNEGGAAFALGTIPPGAKTYTVKDGDTLLGISLRAGVSVDELRRLNNISGNRILAGQILILDPGPPAATLPAANASPTGAASATPVPATEIALAPTAAIGDLCIVVYEDVNANGKHDPVGGEGQLAGLGLNLTRAEDGRQSVVGGFISDGQNEPRCFRSLPPVDYQLVFTPPTGYVATTPENPRVTVVPSAVLTVEIGLTPLEAAARRAQVRTLTIAGAAAAALLSAFFAVRYLPSAIRDMQSAKGR
ncbi:MAG: LysM peptidoglycan-binding domain-containing protein [Chloroflexi bacterium]|nr:LysM peptidoglycan-binding domain-containing protein [Chloroflexota bacterium]